MNSEKILIVTYLMLYLIILNIFHGNLIYIYNRFETFSGFNNFQEFADSGIPVLPYRQEMARIFNSEEVKKLRPEYRQLSDIMNSAKTLINIADHQRIITNFDNYTARGFAIFTSLSMAQKKITENMRRNNGSTSLVLLDILPCEGFMVCLFNQKIKFLPQLDNQILHLQSSDLIRRWYESSVDLYSLKKMTLHLHKGKNIHQLTLLELQVCFILYAIGAAVSCITFILELLFRKL